jgi:hypothetical protein
MADLRTALEEAFNDTNNEVKDEPIVESNPVVEENVAEEVEKADRNEKGQFVAKEEGQPTEIEASDAVEVEEQEYKPSVARPTTWKKDYLPLWDKMEKGEALTVEESRKMLEYANQRESEYKKGVSTYKAEADSAKQLREAIDPFMPELQKHGIHPAAWINNLGRAHYILANGSQDQKQQMFQKLAQDYGIALNLDSGENTTLQYADPQSQALMQQIQALNNQVAQVTNWKQQEESARLNTEIERFKSDVEKHPHFEAVREQMAQLLENGLAPDLETAYAKAVRLNDEVWSAEQNRLLEQTKQAAIKAQQVAKAKSVAVSPKSVTPSGKVVSTEKKDRKSIIAEQLGLSDNRV